MTVAYSNNATSKLSASISNVATSLSVTSGHGARFPSLSAGIWFYLTLINSAGSNEIVKVTARSGDTMTVERAQDGTSALAFSVDDVVELRITKAMLDDFKSDTRSGINSSQVTTALGFTPYNGDSNPYGFITSAALAPYAQTAALGSYLTTASAASTYLAKTGDALTGSLTVGGDLLFAAVEGGARTIGLSSGSNTSLVLQSGAASGTGANLELTASKYAYLDADASSIRSNDGTTSFAVFSAAGVSIGTLTPTGYGKLTVRGQEAGTATATLAAVTTGAAQGERTDLAMYATFVGTGDNGVRRVADIVSGFTGAWGTEYLGLHVGNGGAANDTKLLTTEIVRLTRFGAGVTGTLSATGAITQNGNQVLHEDNYTSYVYSHADINLLLSFKRDIQFRTIGVANGTSITMDADATDTAYQINTQAAGTLTINAPTALMLYDGQKLMLRISSTNVQTFAWNPIFRGSTDQPLPTATSGGGKEDYMGFMYDIASDKWDLIAKNFGF